MEPDVIQERRQAHALLDMLTPEKLNAVRSLLEVSKRLVIHHRAGAAAMVVAADFALQG